MIRNERDENWGTYSAWGVRNQVLAERGQLQRRGKVNGGQMLDTKGRILDVKG